MTLLKLAMFTDDNKFETERKKTKLTNKILIGALVFIVLVNTINAINYIF